MSRNVILMITEGETPEKHIINNIKSNFFDTIKEEAVFLPFKLNIYMLWKKLKEDDFDTNVVDLLKEMDEKANKILQNYENDDISQIYLFFDYDGQAHPEPDGERILGEMLEVFDNETEFGKLYISYPMVEAIRDIKNKDKCYRRCLVEAKENIKYKNLVHEILEFQDVRKYSEDQWKIIIKHNLKKANCMIFSKYEIPEYEIYQSKINSQSIFINQLDKYIKQYKKIAVLSCFPFFLLDYFNEEFFKKILL